MTTIPPLPFTGQQLRDTLTALDAATTGKEAAGTAAAAVASHAAAADPHPQYLTTAEGNAAYAAAGAPVAAVTTHEAAADPHPQYLTTAEGNAAYAAAGAPVAAVTTHEAAADPHPQYLTTAEGNAAYATAAQGAKADAAAVAGAIGSSGLTMTAGILGRESGTGAPQVFTLGSGLSIVGGALVVTGGTAGVTSATAPLIYDAGTNTIGIAAPAGGVDQFLLWDASQGAWVPGSIGAGLEITGTTLSATSGVSSPGGNIYLFTNFV